MNKQDSQLFFIPKLLTVNLLQLFEKSSIKSRHMPPAVHRMGGTGIIFSNYPSICARMGRAMEAFSDQFAVKFSSSEMQCIVQHNIDNYIVSLLISPN